MKKLTQRAKVHQIKDLRLGSQLAANIETREEYASQRLAQVTVAES